MRRLLSIVVVSFCAALPANELAAAPAALRVDRTAGQVAVEGATPGARIVLFAMTARNVRGMLTKHEVAEIVADTDGDGVILFAPPDGIPIRSVWAAVDLTSGTIITASPEGYRLDRQAIAIREVKKDSDGLVEALEMERQRVHFLLVRPGDGAWTLSAREGGGADGDGAQNGRLTIHFERTQSLAGDGRKAPKKLKAGDVLVAIDSARFTIRTLTVEP